MGDLSPSSMPHADTHLPSSTGSFRLLRRVHDDHHRDRTRAAHERWGGRRCANVGRFDRRADGRWQPRCRRLDPRRVGAGSHPSSHLFRTVFEGRCDLSTRKQVHRARPERHGFGALRIAQGRKHLQDRRGQDDELRTSLPSARQLRCATRAHDRKGLRERRHAARRRTERDDFGMLLSRELHQGERRRFSSATDRRAIKGGGTITELLLDISGPTN